MNRLPRAAAAAILGLTLFGAVPSLAAAAIASDYGDAMRWYEREAAKGSAKAQFLLGLL